MKRYFLSAAAAAVMLLSTAAQAGPVIIDGTDSGDHGSATATINLNGWEYMQRALENLGGSVNSSAAKVVTVIGTASGEGQAYNSISSAFSKSSLASSWTINYVSGVASINAFMGTLSTANTGILYLSTAGLVAGDMSGTELAAVNAAAAAINTYVSGAGNPSLGGALFAQGETGAGEFGWLATLIPGIISTDIGGGGLGTNITLTASGATAFPQLTNTDLAGADPWHSYFSGNLGGLSALGTALDNTGATRNLIIGGGAGTVLQCGTPGQPSCQTVSEPGAMPLLAIAAFGMVAGRLRRRNKK